MLTTMTNDIGCKFAKNMKQLVHLIALASGDSPALAQLQFQKDLSLKFEFGGPILMK